MLLTYCTHVFEAIKNRKPLILLGFAILFSLSARRESNISYKLKALKKEALRDFQFLRTQERTQVELIIMKNFNTN